MTQPDNLRERIANAMSDEFDRRGRVAEWVWLADAVIRELGLREERDWKAVGRWGESSPHMIIDRRRYVTDWATSRRRLLAASEPDENTPPATDERKRP